MHGVFEIGCPIRRRRAALDRIGVQCRAEGPALDRIGFQCRALGPALDRIGVQTRLECGPTWDHTACPCTVLDRPPLHWTPRCTQCTGCLKLAAQSGGEGLRTFGLFLSALICSVHWIGSDPDHQSARCIGSDWDPMHAAELCIGSDWISDILRGHVFVWIGLNACIIFEVAANI